MLQEPAAYTIGLTIFLIRLSRMGQTTTGHCWSFYNNVFSSFFPGAIVSSYDDTFSMLWIVSVLQKYADLVQVNVDKGQ